MLETLYMCVCVHACTCVCMCISCVLVNAQDPLAEGLQRIKNILQTSGQLFGGTNRDSGNSNRRPLLFDGKKFLLQEQSVVVK